MSKKPKKPATMGPVRSNLEAFGVAILGAVLLKWFCIEAFQIPTSSMQPTLMGSNEAGIYDRLLVDKLTPALREPQRWDVTVFNYPLQQNQSYVKRLVGLPGENLYIGGGNLHTVVERDGQRVFTTLRKPPRIQEQMWKEVFPARLLLGGETRPLGSRCLSASPSNAWREGEAPDEFEVALEGSRLARLVFRDEANGGFVDRVYDGYPTAWAQAIARGAGPDAEIVPDARIAVTIEPERALEELAFEIEVARPGQGTLTYALAIRGGRGRLLVRDGSGEQAASPEFALETPAGQATKIAFAHLDDELIAWCNGTERQRLDVADHHCREGCAIPRASDGPPAAATPEHRVTPQLVFRSQGRVRLRGLRIDRDLHYTKRGFPFVQDLIRVPEGHYFMMGDNTLQSVDSRGWTALALGLLDDGTVVPPEMARAQGGRVLRGNKRIMPPHVPPDRDETPIAFPARGRIAMIDEFGDVHALLARATVVTGDSDYTLSIQPPGSQDGREDWRPPTEWVPFVPREHVQGRALLLFWRWPFPRLSPIK